MIRRAVLVAALVAGNAFAQAPEIDPDSPATHRRAVEALAGTKPLPIEGQPLEIVPVVLEVKGVALGVDGLLRDLNAEVRGREVRIAMSADVLFDFDKADLRKEARPELEKLAAVLKEYPNATARIEGHADGKGDRPDRKLSQRS